MKRRSNYRPPPQSRTGIIFLQTAQYEKAAARLEADLLCTRCKINPRIDNITGCTVCVDCWANRQQS